VPIASFWADFENWALNALPVFEIVFLLAMVTLLALVVKSLPRTKPQEIKPDSASAVGWEDIAGVEDARAELQEVVEFLSNPQRFAKLGARVPRGVLLHGPPGTGKTLLAKAVAHESGARFYAQSAAGFVEMFAGLGAARVRRLFRIARKNEPSIIFIDELDAVGGQRGMGFSGEKDQTLNQLLIEMDGFASTDRLVVIAASNLIDKLDAALLRPGRFDRQIYVAPPDVHAREEILRVHVRDKPI
jgi:cell division protease FtsH